MKEKVNSATSPKNLWERLLNIGIFSIGPFVVSVHGELIRVYHMRMNDICYCSRKVSFYEMKRLCSERGYTFDYLLSRSSPKSFLPINRISGKNDVIQKKVAQPPDTSTRKTTKIPDNIHDGLRMFGNVLSEETTTAPGRE